MAIRHLQFDKDVFTAMGVGLPTLPLAEHPVDMRNLGKVVLLAGPNGAGKTRFLNLISSLSPVVRTSVQIAALAARLDAAKEEYLRATAHVDNLAQGIKTVSADGNPPTKKLRDELDSQTQYLNIRRGEYEALERDMRVSHAVVMSHADGLIPVPFVPKGSRLTDPGLNADKFVREQAARMLHLGCQDSETNAPAYARSVMRAALVAWQKRVQASPVRDEKSEKEEVRDGLLSQIKTLLGVEVQVELTDDQNLKIAGSEQYWNELSTGQQVLFQFACMLHAQQKGIDNAIVLMDEPENHLHPAVLNEVVDRILASLTHGQLWIATHSVPLIAHLVQKEPDCLWYVSNGEFKRAGRCPSVVLEGLLGGPQGAEALHALTLLPAQYAATRFLVECLASPGVVGANVNDPQTQQIAAVIAKRRTSSDPVRVLDYGAGVGRTLATLAAMSADAVSWLDYFAFEPSSENHAALQCEIEAVYGTDASRRVIKDRHCLDQLDPSTVDVVVMCNVLHEIPPNDWIRDLGPQSPIARLLAEDGHLLVVEDYAIPVGELAHAYGFLLLDQSELRALFDVREADRANGNFIRAESEARQPGRLVAHLIGRSCLAKVSPQTRRAAIDKLRERMDNELRRLRSPERGSETPANGRDYARAAMLHTNASLWLTDNPPAHGAVE